MLGPITGRGVPRPRGLRRRRTRAWTVLLVTCLIGPAGCSLGPLPVESPTPDERTRAVCSQLMRTLPDQVLDTARRSTDPPGLTAAWGSPAIVLRCGVDRPPGASQTSQCLEVNGVGWYVEQGQGGTLYSTLGRTVTVEVGVPDRYAPEATALTDLAESVATVPVVQPCL